MTFLTIAENGRETSPDRLTASPKSAMLPATCRAWGIEKVGEMTTVATKFQVTVAAAAVAAGAAFVPVAANAAPQIQLPAAPSFADLPLQPKGPVYVVTAASLQLYSVFVKQSAASQERRSSRLEAYAAAHPDTFFGQLAATRAAQIRSAQAITNNISFDVCLGGNSVGIGPYGTVTSGSC